MVRHCNLTHKPDRFPAGAFFQGTAYRRVEMEDGRKRLAVRAALRELTDNNGSLDKARKGIGDIVSDETRQIVSDEFERRLKQGKSVKEALAEPIRDTRYDPRDGRQAPPKFIAAVRVYQRIGRGFVDGEKAEPIEHKQRDGTVLLKFYLSDGYAYLSLKLENGQLTSAESIPLHVAPRRPTVKEYGEIRFYPNETLLDTESDRRYVIRQIRDNAALALTIVTEAREVRDMDKHSGLRTVRGKELLKFKHI